MEMDEVDFFVSMRPGTRQALEKYNILPMLKKKKHIHIRDSLASYVETISLVNKCEAILTDSGSMQEEAAALHIPCLTARYVTDRPETVEAGSNILVGLKKAEVMAGLRKVLGDKKFRDKMKKVKSPYGEGDSSERIVKFTEKVMATGNTFRFEKGIRKP
jgi:UDP-N-acetylglucosamine 2-epimerase (non-hydrolysing)